MAGQSDDENSDPIDTALTHGVIGSTTSQAQPQVAAREDDAPPGITQPSPILPDEIIVEILSRTPVKYLLQFRCVCKSWKSLISDPHFIKKHLRESTEDPSFTNYRLLPGRTLEYYCITCPLNSVFDNPSTMAFEFSFPIKYKYIIVMGSCNGLVCLVAHGAERVRICNPTTRLRSKKSPRAANEREEKHDLYTFILFGFGYDHQNDKYKVVKVYCNPAASEHSKKTVVKIYTVGSDSWRQIQSFPYVPLISNHYGRFVPGTGTLNWLAGRTSDSYFAAYPPWKIGSRPVDNLAIVSLDLEKEIYGEVLLPDLDVNELDFDKPMLGALRDCLCFFYNKGGTHYHMWMMKEYGVKESWTKLITISYLDIRIVGQFHFTEPLFMSQNGEFLMICNPEERLVLYSPRDNTIKYPLIRDWLSVVAYVESLVSPNF